MLAIKGFILSFFGCLMLLGSPDPSLLSRETYVPEESIAATEDQEHTPLFFDAVLELNQSSTYEAPFGKIYSPIYNTSFQEAFPIFYPLYYYKIGQQIIVNLTTKTIIFPFHCFT